jgi:hypothetical protein
MPNVRLKSASQLEQNRLLSWFCGKTLKQVMIDHGIDNIELAKLAQVDRSVVSRLRNGNLSQLNYVIVIRALPPEARKQYLDRIFFDPLPEKLAPEIKEKIAEKVKKRSRSRSAKSEEN